MVAAIAGVAVGVGGIVNGISSSNAAGKAAKNQQQAIDAQTALGQSQLDWNKDRYNEWDSEFQPIMQDMMATATRNNQPDYAKVGSDVNSAFDAQEQSADRNMNRMGIKPTDGAYGASQTAYGLGRAAALVSGNQTERHTVANQQLSNLEGVYNAGTPMLTGSMSGVNTAGGQASSAYGNAASTYGQQAGQYGMAGAASISGGLGALGTVASNMGGNGTPYVAPYTPGSIAPPTATWGISNPGASYTPPPITI